MSKENGTKMIDSLKLAKLWVELDAVRTKLDNELIPISGYLGVEDTELIDSMENFSNAIKNHFEQFDLKAEKQN